MPDSFYTKPADISIGLQMLDRGLTSRAARKLEETREKKKINLQQETTKVIQRGNPDEIMSFVAENPDAADIIQKAKSAKVDSMVEASKRWLINQEDPFEVHTSEAEKAIAEGRDPAGNIEMARAVMSTQEREQARKMHETVLAMYDPDGYKKYKDIKEDRTGRKKQKTGAYLVKNEAGDTKIVAGVFHPDTGKITVEGDTLPEGYEPVSKLGETGAEETERKVGQKQQEKRVIGQEAHAATLIQRGTDAAETTAIIRRGIELIDLIKTGGFAAASLKAKSILGIESAEEGELSNLLGKNVLSQLRETFGAAFTEREGARLERIEASFGKSPEANKRLLEQTLKIAEKTAKRAMDAAYNRGDMEKVNDINDLLKFSLNPQEEEKKDNDPLGIR